MSVGRPTEVIVLRPAADRADAASEFIESLGLTIHGSPSASSLDAVRAGTPPTVPIEVRDAFVAGFLRVAADSPSDRDP
jgi:hypothetical protein